MIGVEGNDSAPKFMQKLKVMQAMSNSDDELPPSPMDFSDEVDPPVEEETKSNELSNLNLAVDDSDDEQSVTSSISQRRDLSEIENEREEPSQSPSPQHGSDDEQSVTSSISQRSEIDTMNTMNRDEHDEPSQSPSPQDMQDGSDEEHDSDNECQLKSSSVIGSNLADSDSDEEILVKRKKGSKMNRSLLDDSDDEITDATRVSTIQDSDDEAGSGKSDEEDASLTQNRRMRVKRMLDDSDTDDDSEIGSATAESESHESEKTNANNKPVLRNDIFDTEMNSEESDDGSNSDGSDDERADNNDGDDANDDGFVAPKSGRWSKGKGASKTPTEKKHREKALQAREIHSETQRMIREARVKLPYHQPKPLNLQDILNRRNNKQIAAPQLRPTTSLIRQMSLDSPKTKKRPTNIVPTSDDMEDKPSEETGKVSDKAVTDLVVDTVDGVKLNEAKETADSDDDLDHLPDLIVESAPSESQTELREESCANQSEGANNVNLKPLTEDSGFVTTPFSSSDDDSNGAKKAVEASQKEQCDLIEDLPMDVLPDIVHRGSGDAATSKSNQKVSKDTEDVLQQNDCGGKENVVPCNGLDTVDGGSCSTKKIRSKLDLLADVELPSLNPKLDSGAGDFIDLDMDDESESMTGVQGLMSRLMKHAKKVSPKAAKKIEVSYVHKECDEAEKEVLKLGKISYELEAEQALDPKLQVPGAKLQLLKEKLLGGMKARREEARQKRIEAFAFDNEEGFVDEEEEEAELTDQTDTDVENEPEQDEEEEVEEMEKEAQPYAEEEAEEDDNDFADEDNMRLELNSSDSEHADDEDEEQETSIKDSSKNAKEKIQRQESTISEEDKLLLKTPTLLRSQSVTSDTTPKEEFLVPSARRQRFPSDRSTQDMFTPFSKVACSSTDKSKGFSASKTPGLSLPIEETQDLYRSDTSESHIAETPKDVSSDQMDESQMLDEDGFLKVNKSASKKYIRRQLNLADENSATQDNMNELLGLCSGRFPTGSDKDKDGVDKDENNDMSELLGLCSGRFPSNTADQEQDDVNELLGLCSGKFPSATQASQAAQKKLSMKGLFTQGPNSTQDNVDELLGLCSGQFSKRSKLSNNNDLDDTQGNMDELMGLCSGKFPTDSAHSAKKSLMQSQCGDTQSNEDELIGLCSGKFPTDGNGTQLAKKLPMSSQCGGDTQSNLDELMGLCSGKFSNGNTQSRKKTTGPFSQFGDTQSNMDELMGLCSGKFTSRDSKSKKKLSLLSDDDDSDGGEDLDLQVLSGEEDDDSTINRRKNAPTALDSDEDINDTDDDEEEGGNSDEETEAAKAVNFKGFTNKKGKIRKEFMEAEAELSGSEYDSDENLDLDERDDIMEVEEGDKDDVGTEEELRNQVGRVHMKTVQDEDDRELRFFQEMYLQDGDLHSEGQGRQRKFRWKNIDDDTQQDMFDNNSDNEQNDEDGEQESKWRMERFARERWLEEQKEAQPEVETIEEDSQLMKFGSVVLKKMRGAGGFAAMEKVQPASQPSVKSPGAPSTPKSIFRQKQRRGSFLTRSKEALAVIAERTKPVSNPVAPVNSRNCVFSAISPQKAKKIPVKRSISATGSQPASKRPKLERNNTFSGNSIFKLMEH